jgi:LysM repeat protein
MTQPRSLLTAAVVLALTSLPAQAQDADATEGGPEEGAVKVAPGAKGEKAEKGGDTTHTVEKGDTLWDLSQKILGSPWYWPKVWSYNPEIANPHWIYPGNQVRFKGTAEEVPTQVEAGTGPEEDVEPAQMIDDADRVQVSGKIGYTPKDGVHVRLEGFVTPKEVEEAGVISGSYGESEFLSFPQQLYVTFKKAGSVKVGDPYLIFRTEVETSAGYVTHILGTAKVVRWSDKQKIATLEIVGDWDDISRGDLVGPESESFFKRIVVKPNGKEVKDALIVAAIRPKFGNWAENEQVVVDKGSDQGVEAGNVFTIFRQMDGIHHKDPISQPYRLDEDWPKEDVGQCMAVEVKNETSVCILIRSMREIMPGDHCEMRVKAAGGGSSASR